MDLKQMQSALQIILYSWSILLPYIECIQRVHELGLGLRRFIGVLQMHGHTLMSAPADTLLVHERSSFATQLQSKLLREYARVQHVVQKDRTQVRKACARRHSVQSFDGLSSTTISTVSLLSYGCLAALGYAVHSLAMPFLSLSNTHKKTDSHTA